LKIRKPFRFVVIGLVVAGIATMVVNNCVFFRKQAASTPELLAHRGLAQTFDIEKVKWNTNTARIIRKPVYDYIENTILSMQIAFEYGADIVEFDVRVTKDKQLAVFHDYLLEYRTEKSGQVSDYTMQELRKLDVGYGYTFDNGKTFPLRGKGKGLMPSIDDVFKVFKGKKFLIHIRDEGPEIGILLLKKFEELNRDELKRISIYGNDEAIEIVKAKYPKMPALSMRRIKKALIEYELVGWMGIIPESMKYSEIHLPLKYARFLWGWPSIFLARVKKAHSRLVLVTLRGQWSGGFDNDHDLSEIPVGYNGCIWTERIDVIGKKYKRY
jgi:glycerophosphoryl diester phosphodiesterase